MNYAIPFDTLAYMQELEKAGIPSAHAQAQAKALVNVLQNVDEARLQDLATKGDILRVENNVESVKREIEASKADTIKWTTSMFVAQTALIIGAMFAVMKMNQPNPAPYHPPAAQELRLPAPPASR